MPITFGIYDFFSYAIPGVFYILAVSRLLKIFNPESVDVTQLATNLGSAAFWVIVAYVTGQLMDTFGIRWYTLFNHFHAETRAMKEFKERSADLDIDFNLADRKVLFSVVRYNKPELAQFLDGFKAISIMLNNISLALFLLGVVELIPLAARGLSLLGVAQLTPFAAKAPYVLPVLIPLAAFGLSYVAVKRSRLFNEWHWCAVFEHARQFGRSVPEMFGMEKKQETLGTENATLPKPVASAAKVNLLPNPAHSGNDRKKRKQ